MSTDEYVPSDEQVEFAYIEFESEPSSHFADDNLLTRAEAQARWSRWLARVRRDAWDEGFAYSTSGNTIPANPHEETP